MYDFRNMINKNVRVVLQCAPDRVWIYDGQLLGVGDVHLFVLQPNGEQVAIMINSIQSLVAKEVKTEQ